MIDRIETSCHRLPELPCPPMPAPQERRVARRWLLLPWIGLIVAATVGCWREKENEIVAYTALDQEFSAPIYERFQRETGVSVAAKFDVESTKTIGLVAAILAERRRPRADLFWNNEILHTLRLEREGLLEPFHPRHGDAFPARFRSPNGAWHGFAARARVLLVNTRRIAGRSRPEAIADLVAEQWKGDVAIAKPLFGTTATHAACLFQVWGDGRAKEFFHRLRSNARILSGNKQVAQAVASGEVAFGITDTDDAIAEVERGQPVEIVYPDQEPEGLGTLFIPNAIAIIKGGPHTDLAKRLADYLLSPEVETLLAEGPSAQIPLHPAAKRSERVPSPSDVRVMEVDFGAAGERWDEVAKFLRDEFAAP